MANVVLDDVVKSFGDVVAVDHVNLEIEDGEFMALVGPSGCGKTTTLNMVAGLIELTSGTIAIGGKVVNDLDPKDRDIAMVFQNYALYPNKSVAENLAFPLQMRKVSKSDIEVRVKRAAEILSISHLLNRKPRQLSGGQQQRVALGRALVRDPKAFLMDEPLSNLDAMLRVQMRSELKRLHQQFSTTVIYVTHDQMEAMTMADRIAVMSGGVLQQVGTPDDIYNRPANTFVAGFVGSPAMNFLSGNVTTSNDETAIQGSGWTLPLSQRNISRVGGSTTSEVIVGARHTNLTVLPEDATSGLPARVYTIEPTGDLTFVHVWLGEQLVVASTPGTYHGVADQPIRLEFDQDRLYLFDAETKRAL
ncbi:MAG: ABC transporter ATP-binding protein [Chloroflexi bacterium]|nr:ABC transporter ATP-binding protein [Chloroflexota bacterium]MBV9135408.1 ABC transporter ATP-binding protein [Chloroflexota bacterium]MBV9893892.1 ABC transporter ATP-binding protein [Chloroflexota bacterium]